MIFTAKHPLSMACGCDICTTWRCLRIDTDPTVAWAREEALSYQEGQVWHEAWGIL